MTTDAKSQPGKLLADSAPNVKSHGTTGIFSLAVPSIPIMKAIFMGFIMLLAAQAIRAQKTSVITAVPMETDPEHKMVQVPCKVSGADRRYVCIVDSGATNTIISDRVLKGGRSTSNVTTGNGVVRVHQREVLLTIGDGVEFRLNVYVQPAMVRGVDILIGQDVLRQFKFVILDYENRQVEFQK
jgi:gag-polyprotein putative aspartyl protease